MGKVWIWVQGAIMPKKNGDNWFVYSLNIKPKDVIPLAAALVP